MRDFTAAVIAVFLLLVALSLAAALQAYRIRRIRARSAEKSKGRTVTAEIPSGTDLVLFSEDATRFYYGDRPIDKASVVSARLLVNGSVVASCVSARYPNYPVPAAMAFEDQPEGILRDRWDVAIDTHADSLLIECGSIRERVSQETARAIYATLRKVLEAGVRTPASSTIPSREHERDD